MRFASLLLCLIVLGGCSDQPQAPALINEPVYEDEEEGIRFLAPEGWSLRGKSSLPEGPITKDRLLVEYRQLTGLEAATFELTRCDLPEDGDLQKHLSKPSYGVKEWKLKTPVEELEVGGLPARRLIFSGKFEHAELIKEVVAVQRGGRHYFFSALFWSSDPDTREQIRRAVASTIWKS